MLTLNDGRTELWQWDTGRKLSVDADCSQVHFSNKVFGRSTDVDVVDGVAVIPDILLQTDKDLNVWAFVGMAENGYTKISKTFKVNRRNKPADYVFTPIEQMTIDEIAAIAQSVRDDADAGMFNGKDGYTPVKGIDYFTDKDKTEIAEMAAGLVEIPDSGGNANVEPAEDDIPKVYFTGTLPTSKAEDDVKLTMHYISKTADFTYPVTLKVQGHTSANFPKKNFTLKPYKDSTYEKKQKLAFKGWHEMNKFVLKAHWIDHSHVRNVGTAKLWGKIVQSRSDYASLPEELRTAPNNGATDGFTVKVFANGVYQGLYEWIVPKDKLFGQDSDIASHSIMNSELNNQPSCAFSTTTPNVNGNWSEELQDSMSSAISNSFANFIKFVAGSTDEEFVANAENYFDVQSVIDFNIFARVFCIVDNLCKNQIFFTYDGTKWYEGCWDVDGVLGAHPVGGNFFAYNTEFQTGYIAYKDFKITNLLYQRVENLFMERFKARYAELRAGVLSVENVIEVYERLTDTIVSHGNLLEEDFAATTAGGAFTGIPHTSDNNIQQIRNFVAKRIPYMDEKISTMVKQVPCTGISLDASTLTFTAEGTKILTATVSPDGCTDEITWESNNPSVAVVDGGVVTAIDNGAATITAKCGNYSATCSVTVSGITVIQYTITNNLDNITSNNNSVSVVEGESYTATLTPADGYNISTVTVTMGGTDITATAYANGVVSIGSVTGNVVITATATEVAKYVNSFAESTWTESGYYNDTTGVLTPYNGMYASQFIAIQPKADIYTQTAIGQHKNMRVCYFDSEYNWISNQTLMDQSGYVNLAPDNAVYYKLCSINSDKDAISVTTTEYEYPSENIMEAVTWEAGTFIVNSGVSTSGGFTTNAFNVPDIGGAVVTLSFEPISGDNNRIFFWDADGSYISGAYTFTSPMRVEIPDNASTARVSVNTSGSKCQILMGNRVIGESTAAV